MSPAGSFNARAALSNVQNDLLTHDIRGNILQLAKNAKYLSSPDYFDAERLLSFYLRPDRTNDQFQQTLFNGWKDLIRKLDQSDYAGAVPLIAIMSAKFEYIPLEDPRHAEYRTFHRQIQVPHDAAYRKTCYSSVTNPDARKRKPC